MCFIHPTRSARAETPATHIIPKTLAQAHTHVNPSKSTKKSHTLPLKPLFLSLFLAKIKKKLSKIWALHKKVLTLHRKRKKGGLAQLARALAWHARGHRFDSDILHKINKRLSFRQSFIVISHPFFVIPHPFFVMSHPFFVISHPLFVTSLRYPP